MIVIAEHKHYKVYRDSSTESGAEFYARMGKWFSSREIIKEMDGPIYDDSAHVWLLAYAGNELVGFACIDTTHLPARKTVELTYAYVFPVHRGKGLHSLLFDLRMTLAYEMGANTIKGLGNGKSNSKFLEHGFEIVRKNGRFTHFKKEIANV